MGKHSSKPGCTDITHLRTGPADADKVIVYGRRREQDRSVPVCNDHAADEYGRRREEFQSGLWDRLGVHGAR